LGRIREYMDERIDVQIDETKNIEEMIDYQA